jgi:DNA primase
MKAEGISFRHAVEWLREQHDVSTPINGPLPKKSSTKQLPSPLSAEADAQTLLQQVVAFYHETLKQAPEVLAYLEKRGLNHPELLSTFKLGYANRTLSYRLPIRLVKAGAHIRGALQQLGVMRESGHEHLNGSLVIPLTNERGDIVQMYGRKITDSLRAGTPKHLYLPGDHGGIFNAVCLHASDEIIVCEALIDALTFWVHGFRNVTSAYGVNGFTDEMLVAFKAHKIKRVLIAFDRDDAGDKGAAELAKKLIAIGVECYRVQLPKGMDANEYALQVKPAQKSLSLVLRKAEWMGAGAVQGCTNVAGAGCAGATKAPVRDEDNIEAITENDDDTVNQSTAPTLTNAENLSVLAAQLPEPSASPMPSQTANDVDATVTENEVHLNLGERRYRVRGLAKASSYDVLKINLMVSAGEHFHVDTLDLYSAKARTHYITQAAIELGVNGEVLKTDLGKLLRKLEALQEQRLQKTLTPQKAAVVIDDEQRTAALDLLRAPDLLNRVLNDLHSCGVIGEDTNKLTAYLACVSRKLSKPLAIIIQSSSAAGKSSLLDAVLSLMPDEERVQYSAMTGQSLFYMGETNLKNKILAIAEEEGAHRAAYALKLLQSDGGLTIASTGKDPVSGNLITQEYRVEGPVMIALTTTAIEIDEELLNRCVVLTVNETREQTRAIHALQRQRQTLQGLLQDEERKVLIDLHRNAQRLLRPLAVVNPFAEQLTFLDAQTRTRRDHMKYLTLIQSITLLHQYQRQIKQAQHKSKALDYIEVTLDDIALANQLAHEVLGRTLDELPPQTRKLLDLLDDMVVERCTQQVMKVSDFRFSRKEVRDYVQWGNTQLKVHMQRLEEMEFLIVNFH